MSPVGCGLEFRMVLAGDEEGMGGKFHDFHQAVFIINGADDHACVFQFFTVGRVEFVTVAVAFRMVAPMALIPFCSS